MRKIVRDYILTITTFIIVFIFLDRYSNRTWMNNGKNWYILFMLIIFTIIYFIKIVLYLKKNKPDLYKKYSLVLISSVMIIIVLTIASALYVNDMLLKTQTFI